MSEQLLSTPCTFGENGNFLLERELGSGGMGGVYMGRDKMLDRPVAVKVMLKEYGADAEFVEKFKKEAQSAARLIHPNIAQVYSYGISDGMPYIAMELVAGGSLWNIMQANPGKTDVTRVLKICQQVAQALQCSTDQGCIHGDIKPENILLDANGNAKLVDFGLAGMQKDTKEIWGTPYYIAPEKVQQQVIDFRSDMYNLGGTLYHALTDKPPFDGDDVAEVVKARFMAPPKKPSEIRSDLTPQVDQLVMRMLEQDKDKRFPSFEALIEEFKRVLTSGLEAAKPAEPSGAAATTAKAAGAPATKGGVTRRTTLRRPTGMRRAVTPATAAAKAVEPATEEEEEGGGNLGLKVVGVVVGVILLLGGIGGGLYWYTVADKKAKAERLQKEVVDGIAKAHESITGNREQVVKFVNEFETKSAETMAKCEKTRDELKVILPDWAAELEAPNPAVSNAPNAVVEGEAKREPPAAVIKMQEFWQKALECRDCTVRVRQGASNILELCDSAVRITGATDKALEDLGGISRQVDEKFKALKSSKDVETANKCRGIVNTRAGEVVEMARKLQRADEKKKAEQLRKEQEAEEDRRRQEAAAEAKAKAIEHETGLAKAKFESIVSLGLLRQLNWDKAIGQLNSLKAEFKTVEGGFAVDTEIEKVQAMKKVQDVLIENIKDYTFTRGKDLRGRRVVRVDAKMIGIQRKDGKSVQDLPWQKFYADYHGNLDELITRYVVNGRKNCRRKPNIKEWAEAMSGAALTLRIVCSGNESAVAYGEDLVKQAAKEFPKYVGELRKMFPDIELTDSLDE